MDILFIYFILGYSLICNFEEQWTWMIFPEDRTSAAVLTDLGSHFY